MPRRELAKFVFYNTKDDDFFITSSKPALVVSTKDKQASAALFSEPLRELNKVKKAIDIGQIPLGGKLVDIGANVGQICIPGVDKGWFSNAIAIEPDAKNFLILQANIALNNQNQNIRAVNVALSDTQDQHIQLALSEDNFGDHRIALGQTETRTVTTVANSTLDFIIENESGISLIWMDVQGFEAFVLNGAHRTLTEGLPLVCEFWPKGMKSFGSYDLFKDLLFKNYSMFCDLGDHNAKIVDISELHQVYKKLGEGGPFTDLLFLR
ncbi:FkbM family methyltransferase [Pseudomonadales bacterium]|nr:FkbM family methyltransferase [Pseudomonadales bacterium]